jgi:hypothetical protein
MILADSGAALVTAITFLLAFFGSLFSAFQEPAYSASVTMPVPFTAWSA